MTRDHNRDGIVVVGLPDRAESVGTSHVPGDLCVTSSLAERNMQQFVPASLLELCAAKIERNGEFTTSAREILVQLLACRFRRCRRILPTEGSSSQSIGKLGVKGENH